MRQELLITLGSKNGLTSDFVHFRSDLLKGGLSIAWSIQRLQERRSKVNLVADYS